MRTRAESRGGMANSPMLEGSEAVYKEQQRDESLHDSLVFSLSTWLPSALCVK